MNAEEALACLENLLPHAHLNKLQVAIFQQVWEDRSYLEIAKNSGYGLSHIKQTGSELWQLLSQRLGEKVNKTNVQTVLKRYTNRDRTEQMPAVLNHSIAPQCDWGEAVDTPAFLGRIAELETLERWIVHDRCRLIGLFGMGGIGKTTLSIRLAQRVAESDELQPFEFVIWRSLRNAPPIRDLLASLMQVFAQDQAPTFSETLEAQIRDLIGYLKAHRCLIILDNAESVMRPHDSTGSFQSGYEGYKELLATIGETQHQSCLILTSREKPSGFAAREGISLPVRSLQLAGLSTSAVQNLLSLRGQLFATETDWQALISHYSGNPLALKIAAGAIADFFNGNIAQFLAFLQQSGCIFADIRDLLASQFHRLTQLEQQILYWLAINREPVSLVDLQADFIPQPQSAALLEALVSLERRCFLERTTPIELPLAQRIALFTLQPVVLEYVTEQFIDQAFDEIMNRAKAAPQTSLLLKTHALIKAQTKDYIRETQVRLILQPLADRLLSMIDRSELDQQLMQLLSHFRGKGRQQTGYLAGNVINLLCQMQVDLSDRDFSDLTILQAYLKRVNLHRVNFAGANLSQSVFTESFSPVLSVAFSADRGLLAAGDVSHDIHVWQVGTQQPVLTLKADGWVWSVAFSPSNQILASSASRSVCLWDVQTGQCVRSLQGYASRIFSIAFSPDGTRLISGSEDQLIRIWNVETGQLLHCLKGHTDEVRSITVHPSGQWFASAGCDRTIRLWDIVSGQCLGKTEAQDATLHSIAFSPNGEQLISSSDRAIQIWTVMLARSTEPDRLNYCCSLFLQQTLQGHTAPIRSIAVCANGDYFASGSNDHTIRIWSLKTGECLRTLYGHTSWISALCFATSGEEYLLASGSEDQSIRLWDSRTAACLQSLQGYSNGIWSIACNPHRSQFVSGGQDRLVRLWDSVTGECLRVMRGHQSWVWSVGFSSDGSVLASSSDDRTIRIWNTNGNCLTVLQGHTDQVYSIAFSPDSLWKTQSLLASGSLDSTVRLWNVHTGNCLYTLQGHSGGVWSVAFNSQGTLLASGSLDQTIRLWDVSALSGNPPKLLKTLSGHTSWVRSVAFSPDGRLLASASADGVLKLWSVETGKLVKTVQAHSSAILCVTFSPDGTTLSSSGIDGTVRVWSLKTNQAYSNSDEDDKRSSVWIPKVLIGHERWVRFLAYCPDQPLLMSCSQDETIKLWHLQTGECQKTIRILRPYESMNIQNIQGLTEAQLTMLKLLGATEVHDRSVAKRAFEKS
ncbi:NB-ARC domain-containing protein [Leptolyngbya sp. AN03gr2]|uniref:WD40 domain-containing protein n=1 Tax=unclassified Leptolyngbya TaxID=2650499 RepID=UPI003D3189A4